MSTRGVVAVGTLKRWKGIYNHCDSYPTYLGKNLYEHLTEQTVKQGKTLAEIGAAILTFDDWSNYINGGLCEYCGKITSEAHSIGGEIFGVAKPGVYPDPECKHHLHDPLDEAEYYSQRDMKKCTWLEWIYIINAAASVIHVLDLRRGPEPSRHVGDMTFTATPDFKVLECGATFERCCHMAWYHFPEIESDSRQSRLGTAEYLGLKPLEDRHYACAYIINGKRYVPTGSGVNGSYALRLNIEGPNHSRIDHPDPTAWYESVEGPDGRTAYRPVSHFTTDHREEPYIGVTWVFPPTKVNPNETFVSRETVAA
jgi:hypothetical protein